MFFLFLAKILLKKTEIKLPYNNDGGLAQLVRASES